MGGGGGVHAVFCAVVGIFRHFFSTSASVGGTRHVSFRLPPCLACQRCRVANYFLSKGFVHHRIGGVFIHCAVLFWYPTPHFCVSVCSPQGTRIVLEGAVEPAEEGIEPGDVVFVLVEARHRTFRRLSAESPHLTADITVSSSSRSCSFFFFYQTVVISSC